MNEKRSLHGGEFNHDSQASTYDNEVIDESNPVRDGYRKTLETVSSIVNSRENVAVVELGSGTGNLTCLFEKYNRIVCVDISPKMQEVAKRKLANFPNIAFEVCDVLEFCSKIEKAEVIASTYALHHLTDQEKKILLNYLCRALPSNGLIVIGDLMFKDQLSRENLLEDFAIRRMNEMVEDIESEFYWDISEASAYISNLGFAVTSEQTGTLSWVLIGRKA